MHSSLLHDLGVPAKVVQQQLGHASISTTLDIYTHVVADTQFVVDSPEWAEDDLEGPKMH